MSDELKVYWCPWRVQLKLIHNSTIIDEGQGPNSGAQSVESRDQRQNSAKSGQTETVKLQVKLYSLGPAVLK